MNGEHRAWAAACLCAARMAHDNPAVNAGLISDAIMAELERHGLRIDLIPAPVRVKPDAYRLARRVGPTAAREYLRPRGQRRAG